MTAAYAQAGIYVLPALYEPFGLTILEAALSGCALVLGDIPSLRENWAGAAVFIPPRNTERLIETVNSLCEDEPLRRRLARLAESRGRRLSAARMAATYSRSYCQLSQLAQPARAFAVA
jgi:glycosyltransferase involved in cell wall biosynthesis